MRQKFTLAVAALAVLLFVAARPTFAANLVTNGSFETGDFTGWTEGGNFEYSQVVSGAYYDYTGAEDGLYYATFGPVGSDGSISQSFATSVGGSYTFSFWLNAVGDDPSDFSAYWDGLQVMSESDPNTGGAWTQYSFNETGTGSDTITFDFRDDPAYIALDNVSVTTGGSQTPEPGSLWLLGSGLLAVGGAIRRKFLA